MKFTCPQCGGLNQPQAAESYLHCEYCQNTLYVDLDALTPVYSFQPVIPAAACEPYVKSHLTGEGYNGPFTVHEVSPVYLPFWKLADQPLLQSACRLFPAAEAAPPAAQPQFFQETAIADGTEVGEIDHLPENAGERGLHYLPFYRVEIHCQQRPYLFFVDAVGGGVWGERIPPRPAGRQGILAAVFALIPLGFFFINRYMDRFMPALLLNVLWLFLSWEFLIAALGASRRRPAAPRRGA